MFTSHIYVDVWCATSSSQDVRQCFVQNRRCYLVYRWWLCENASSSTVIIFKGKKGFCEDFWLKCKTIKKEIKLMATEFYYVWKEKWGSRRSSLMGKKNKIIKKKKGERETIEKISCLVKTIGTCLKKQSRAGNSRRNVSSGSHRIGTQSFLWQIN